MKTNKISTQNPTTIHGRDQHHLPTNTGTGPNSGGIPLQFAASTNPADSYTATTAANTDSPCVPCPHRSTCTRPCAALMARLEHIDYGRMYQTGYSNASERLRQTWLRMREVRILCEHRAAMHGRMRQVVNMTHNDGLTQDEIARKLGIERRTVGRYLARARAFAAKRARG